MKLMLQAEKNSHFDLFSQGGQAFLLTIRYVDDVLRVKVTGPLLINETCISAPN
jgi:hypothetical protein